MSQLQKDVTALVNKYKKPIPLAIDDFLTQMKIQISEKLSDAKIDALFFKGVETKNSMSIQMAAEKLSKRIPLEIKKIDEWITILNKNFHPDFAEPVKILLDLRRGNPRDWSDTNLTSFFELTLRIRYMRNIEHLYTYASGAFRLRLKEKILALLDSPGLPIDQRMSLSFSFLKYPQFKSLERINKLLRDALDRKDAKTLIEMGEEFGKTTFLPFNYHKLEANLLRDIVIFAIVQKSSKLFDAGFLQYVSASELYARPDLYISIFYEPFPGADHRLQAMATSAIQGEVPRKIINHLFKKEVERFYQAIGDRILSLIDHSSKYYVLDDYLDVIIQAVWKGNYDDANKYQYLSQNAKLMKRFNSKFRFFIESFLLNMKEKSDGLIQAKALFEKIQSGKGLIPKNEDLIKRMAQAETVEQMLVLAGIVTQGTCEESFKN